VLCVQPGKSRTGRERGSPLEALVWLQLHAKERIWQAGKIIVVDPRVDESSW